MESQSCTLCITSTVTDSVYIFEGSVYRRKLSKVSVGQSVEYREPWGTCAADAQ